MATSTISKTYRCSTYGYFDFKYTLTETDTTVTLQLNTVTYRNTRSNGLLKKYYADIPLWITNVNTLGTGSGGSSSSNYTLNSTDEIDLYSQAVAKGTKSKTWTLNRNVFVATKGHGAGTINIDHSMVEIYNDNEDYWCDNYADADFNVTIPARTSHKVSYNANGGSTTPTAQTKYYGENITLSKAIAHADTSPGNYLVYIRSADGANTLLNTLTSKRTVKYTFSVWKASGGNTSNWNAGATYNINTTTAVTMTAQWTSAETRANVTFPANPTRTGFGFVRYNANTANTGAAYSPGNAYNPSATVTFYAIWDHTLSYNSNQPSSSVNKTTMSGTVAANKTLATNAWTVAANGFTLPGWKFVNWNSAAAGNGTAYSPTATIAAQTASMTLYAQWTRTLTSVTLGKISVKRVADSSSTTAYDEGTYAYIEVPIIITGASAANATITASITDSSVGGMQSKAESDGNDSVTLTMTIRKSECALESQYTVPFTVTVTSTNSANPQTFTLTGSAVIPTAYYTLAARKGGKGISFGGVAMVDGHNVSMPQYAYNRQTVQTHVSFKKYEDAKSFFDANPSALPAMALLTDDKSLWYFY